MQEDVRHFFCVAAAANSVEGQCKLHLFNSKDDTEVKRFGDVYKVKTKIECLRTVAAQQPSFPPRTST